MSSVNISTISKSLRAKSKSPPVSETKRRQRQTQQHGADQIIWIRAVFAFTAGLKRGFLLSKFGFKYQSPRLCSDTHPLCSAGFLFCFSTNAKMHANVVNAARRRSSGHATNRFLQKDARRCKMKGGKKKIHFTSRTKKKKKGVTNIQKQIYFLADGALFFFFFFVGNSRL